MQITKRIGSLSLLLVLFVLLVVVISCTGVENAPQITNDTNSSIKSDEVVQVKNESIITNKPICKINRNEYVLYKENSEYIVGLKSFTIVDKSGWYKITNATVFVHANDWYLNDLTFECKDKNSALMERYMQIVNITPTSTCYETTVSLNMNMKNLTGEKVCTVSLGQGRVRNGRMLISTEGVVDLKQYVSK